MAADALTSRSYEKQRCTVLELHGALTAGTILKVEPEVARLLAKASRPLVLDLAGVRTIDSTGLIFLAAAAQAAWLHAPLRLAAPAPTVRTALHHTGTLTEVPTFTTVNGAVRNDPFDLLASQPPAP